MLGWRAVYRRRKEAETDSGSWRAMFGAGDVRVGLQGDYLLENATVWSKVAGEPGCIAWSHWKATGRAGEVGAKMFRVKRNAGQQHKEM